jgi:hypothetical protein
MNFNKKMKKKSKIYFFRADFPTECHLSLFIMIYFQHNSNKLKIRKLHNNGLKFENLNFDHNNYYMSFNTQINREFTEYYHFSATRHFWSSLKGHLQSFKTKSHSFGETLSFK